MFGSDILRTAIPQPRRGRIPRRTDEPLRHPRQLLGRPALAAASPLGCRGRGPGAGASSEPLHPAAGSGAGAMPGPASAAASELLCAALRRGDAAGRRGPGSSPPARAWQSEPGLRICPCCTTGGEGTAKASPSPAAAASVAGLTGALASRGGRGGGSARCAGSTCPTHAASHHCRPSQCTGRTDEHV